VPEALDTVLGPDGTAMVEGPVSTERHERAVAATWQAIDRVTGLGFPTTVVHGDFHPGNAALVDGRAVIIDWSDAAIGNPLVDLVTWVSWSAAQPDDERVATDAWVDAWSGVTDSATIRDRIDDILVAGAAYQIVSYEGIVAALEPATRYTMADGASGFLRRLEEILDRT
jgi:aminoglycoside phosphotransferase (APT) family kinase protein